MDEQKNLEMWALQDKFNENILDSVKSLKEMVDALGKLQEVQEK